MNENTILNTDMFTKIVIKNEDDDTVVAVITADDIEPAPHYIAVLTPKYKYPFSERNIDKEGSMDRSKLCITVDEAAEMASVAPAVIRQWAEDFDFPSMKIGQRGGKRLIHLDSFNAWLAKRCQARIGE